MVEIEAQASPINEATIRAESKPIYPQFVLSHKKVIHTPHEVVQAERRNGQRALGNIQSERALCLCSKELSFLPSNGQPKDKSGCNDQRARSAGRASQRIPRYCLSSWQWAAYPNAANSMGDGHGKYNISVFHTMIKCRLR